MSEKRAYGARLGMRADDVATEARPPRVYRTEERTRYALNFYCIALGGLFLCLTLLSLAGLLPRNGPLLDLLCMDLPIAGIVLFVGSVGNRRAILHQDCVEVVGWFRSRKLNFEEIRGRHGTARTPHGGYAYVLVPVDPRKRKLILPVHLHADQFFRDWIKSVPKVAR